MSNGDLQEERAEMMRGENRRGEAMIGLRNRESRGVCCDSFISFISDVTNHSAV